ncbi:MAG: reductive dehalogenase [Marinifilaceae bacterium]
MAKQEKKNHTEKSLNRRDFFKIGAVGAAAGTLSLISAPEKALAGKAAKATKKAVIKTQTEMPNKIRADYKPIHQKDNLFGQAMSMKRPDLAKKFMGFSRELHDNDKPGFTQADQALEFGAHALNATATGFSAASIPDQGLYSWEQKEHGDPHNPLNHNYVSKHKCEFKSKKQASDYIKRAARLYGADLVGITPRDERWDYSGFLNPHRHDGKKEFGWEEFPFKPKSVIVLAFEMDYESVAAAPSYVGSAAPGEGYSQMAKTAFQLSVFLKQMGYHAVASGNDLGLSVPYGVAAGLGEVGRNGCLVTYKYGPRVRVAKVYTDFDFLEYDKPQAFGVEQFCDRCKRCADACPSKAISFADQPTFEPDYGTPDTWVNNPGVRKYYTNSVKCFEFWCESNCDCTSCITSCPYNKPDFWHHELVDTISALMPGPVHNFMREMDIVFGYGDTYDEKAVKKFWDSKNREYNGH